MGLFSNNKTADEVASAIASTLASGGSREDATAAGRRVAERHSIADLKAADAHLADEQSRRR